MSKQISPQSARQVARPRSQRPNAAATQRLFFALWPDAAGRAALAQWQTRVSGRLVPAANLHLTLAFLGQQAAAAVGPLTAILRTLPAPPSLQLTLDCLGYFSGQRIVWAGMRTPPPALLTMQQALTAALAQAGFDPATHGAFRPHVTLARHAAPPDDDGACAPVLWRQTQLALVQSGGADGLYQVLAAR